MVTIGDTKDKIVIRDSGNNYIWYLNGDAKGVKRIIPVVEIESANDTSMAKTMFTLSHQWEFTTKISSLIDWQNLLKALYYWDANNELLILEVKNEWDSNLALFSDKDTPTVLIDETGQLRNIIWQVFPQHIFVRVQFKHLKEVTN